jgi:hypothetical protein
MPAPNLLIYDVAGPLAAGSARVLLATGAAADALAAAGLGIDLTDTIGGGR